jgi:hypothetical protein
MLSWSRVHNRGIVIRSVSTQTSEAKAIVPLRVTPDARFCSEFVTELRARRLRGDTRRALCFAFAAIVLNS